MAIKLYPIDDLLKHGVTNDQGENLGRIDEILVDMELGRIIYGILAFGGFPSRSKYFAVPWELLSFSAHDKKYLLGMPRASLEKGLGYDSVDKVTENPDTNWLGDKYEYYSNKPEWQKRREEERQAELKVLGERRTGIISSAPKQTAAR